MTKTTTTFINRHCASTIKTTLLCISAIVVLLGSLIIGGYSDTHYHTTATVFSVDENGTTFIDGAGYVWGVYDTNYHKGEFVELYFDNNCTDYTRNDDIIVKVKSLDK